MKRPSGNQLTILILSILILIASFGVLYEFFLKPLTTSLHNLHKKAWAEDAERARQLCDYVLQKIKISEKALWETNQPSVLWDAERNSARLEIRRITNPDIQEQIFAAVKEWQATNQALSKVRVQFFESDKPGGEFGERAGTLLREEFIVLTNVQSGLIFNQVAPKN